MIKKLTTNSTKCICGNACHRLSAVPKLIVCHWLRVLTPLPPPPHTDGSQLFQKLRSKATHLNQPESRATCKKPIAMGPSRRLPAPKWTLLVSNSQVPSTPTFLLSPRFFSHPIFLQLQIKTELVKCALKNFTLRNPAPYASCALENLTLGNPAPSASCKRPQKPVDVEIFTLRNPAPAACYNRPQAPLEFCLPFPVRLCLRVRTVSKKDAKLSRANTGL